MLRQVRLEVARGHEFPDGSVEHGYEMTLPLTPDGHLDREAFLHHRNQVGFRRFWGHAEERGHLIHGRRGWGLSFQAGDTSDEVIFKGDMHRFAVGEYISIAERDGVTRTFRVVSLH